MRFLIAMVSACCAIGCSFPAAITSCVDDEECPEGFRCNADELTCVREPDPVDAAVRRDGGVNADRAMPPDSASLPLDAASTDSASSTDSATPSDSAMSTDSAMSADSATTPDSATPTDSTTPPDSSLPDTDDPACSTGCYIVDWCYSAGERNPENLCEYCAPAQNSSAWTAYVDGTSCDDGLVCNGHASCLDGGCSVLSSTICVHACEEQLGGCCGDLGEPCCEDAAQCAPMYACFGHGTGESTCGGSGCGAIGGRCCPDGVCDPGAVCDPYGSGNCVACGGDNQPCCDFGVCKSLRPCVAGLCRNDCGGYHEPCCDGWSCADLYFCCDTVQWGGMQSCYTYYELCPM